MVPQGKFRRLKLDELVRESDYANHRVNSDNVGWCPVLEVQDIEIGQPASQAQDLHFYRRIEPAKTYSCCHLKNPKAKFRRLGLNEVIKEGDYMNAVINGEDSSGWLPVCSLCGDLVSDAAKYLNFYRRIHRKIVD